MKLRQILFVLSLLAVISTIGSGYFYYTKLQLMATNESFIHASRNISAVKNHFSSFLAEQLKPVRSLAGLPSLQKYLTAPHKEAIAEVNILLDHFSLTLGADVCYLMDKDGVTIASSNRREQGSFVGRNFSFRPYFSRALRGIPTTYMALGTASDRRGVYYSYPVMDKRNQQPIGVAVIKASVDIIEDEFRRIDDGHLFLVDPHGIIFLATNSDLLFHSIWPLSGQDEEVIRTSRQFGEGPWPWLGLEKGDIQQSVTLQDITYSVYQQQVEEVPGWSLIYLQHRSSFLTASVAPILKTAGAIILPIFLFISLSVFFLYKKAASEIVQRRAVQQALLESEERYRTLYMHTPAMLHSIDPSGKMVSVSDYWSEALGYTREEVIGRKVTDFMTSESKQYAESTIIPSFMKTGFCKDIAYKFVRKDGALIDVLLSAIAERDNQGNILRSLAVLLDITELKQVENKLKLATEELSNYSKNLEGQVQERTREITNILTHTPAVVYMKDKQGLYLLVNSKFEELFATKNTPIQGKTDFSIFPEKAAKEFRQNDERVLTGQKPIQVEENILVKNEMRTYLSVKFPLFDGEGEIYGVGGISTDITALKKAQQQLQKLSGAILEGQEKERTAISRELHDELGQMLTALRMDAVWLVDKLKTEHSDFLQRAQEMCQLIDSSIDDVRAMALRLRPGILDDLGLIAALEWILDDFEKRSGVVCTFRNDTIPELGPMIATAIYRVTQEALTNVGRHAGASRVDVRLEHIADQLQLTVSDNGQGVDDALLSESEGLGLVGIRERAALIGGKVKLSSAQDTGTVLQLVLPFKAQGQEP